MKVTYIQSRRHNLVTNCVQLDLPAPANAPMLHRAWVIAMYGKYKCQDRFTNRCVRYDGDISWFHPKVDTTLNVTH